MKHRTTPDQNRRRTARPGGHEGMKGDRTMYFLENYRGFGVYLTGSVYIARNRERILTAKTYAEIIECIYLWTCC